MPRTKELTRERAAPNIDLVRKITPAQALRFFGGRMFGPERVQRFAESNPAEFNRAISRSSLFMGLAASPDEPLGNFIRNGNLDISIKFNEEQRRLIIPVDKLEKAGRRMNRPDILRIPSSLLLITGGCTIEQSDNTYTIVFDKKSLDNLAEYLRLCKKPRRGGWYGEIRGMPVGKESTRDDSGSLYYRCLYDAHGSVSTLGTVQRGYYSFAGHGKREIFVGYSVADLSGVLVPAVDLKELAERAETELGDKLAGFPATRRYIEVGKQQACFRS